MGSIKITLYSNEGPFPEITAIAGSRKEHAQLEWVAIVGTAEHLLRNHREHLSVAQLAAVQAFLAAAKECAA